MNIIAHTYYVLCIVAGVAQWAHARLISEHPHKCRFDPCHKRYLGALSKLL